jgi:hypothetical protein
MSSVANFIEQLDAIPWFSNLGKPSLRDSEVFRIYDWCIWPGPEDPGSEMQSAFLMERHNDLFKTVEPIPALRDTWQTIHDGVMLLTKASVPYNEQQDAWFGPNAAVWQAAFTAALVGCTILRDGELKVEDCARMQWTLSNEWLWYLAGHWPCMYYWPWGYASIAVARRPGGEKRLVVY